jgi:predicted ATP-binding protein involved in virulence
VLAINELKITGIGGIDDLELMFNKGLNLICGPNGVGKTTILECICEFFSRNNSNLKRNVKFQKGSCEVSYMTGQDSLHHYSYEKLNYEPSEQSIWHALNPHARKFITFKTDRTFNYSHLDSIGRDPNKDADHLANESVQGTGFFDFKNWFLNRYLFNHIPQQLTETQKNNLQLAIECFGMLDSRVSFSTVKNDTFDILVNTPNGEIYFEYLSSGFKSCIYIIQGLIKEIEFRFKTEGGINVQDFDGLILIDELDLHLHPQWQSKLIHLIKRVLPNAQIIATTHSPHMIQAAEINELIALGLNGNEQIYVRELPNTLYGFQGWTVEEILEDVMGLTETRSERYIEVTSDFETAMNEENEEKVMEAFKKLDMMLHPNNPLRKILRLQIAQIGGLKN